MAIETDVVLETRSVVDALRARIQSQILNGSVRPGTLMAEVSVAQQYDVARPTARAAIDQLVNVGLLRRSRNKTARVPLLDVADIADVYLSRGVIEAAVARLLAERGELPIDAARALERFRAAVANGDTLIELVDSDIAFHRALVAASRSPRLIRLHEGVIGEAHLCMAQVQVNFLLHPQQIADEHTRILEMIEAKDPDGAAAETCAHLARARKKLLAYLRG